MLRLEASSTCALICTTCALHVHIVSKRKKEEHAQETSSSLSHSHRTAELQAHQIHDNNNASLWQLSALLWSLTNGELQYRGFTTIFQESLHKDQCHENWVAAMRIISGSWKTDKALSLHSHGLRSFRPFVRKTEKSWQTQRHATKEGEASAATFRYYYPTSKFSSPTRKENLCQQQQQQPVLSSSRTKKTAAASSSQQANLSFLFRDKTGLFLVCTYNRFQQPFALLVTVWNQRRERWTRTVRVTPRTTFHEAADDGKMRVEGDEKKNSPHAHTQASKQVPELCRRASASWGVGSRGSGRRRPGSRAGSGGGTGVRGRAGGGGRRRHSRLG